ncbi:MAG: Wzz/FepE/Etk N-terminal domain-containing protein [Salibacteraceae bacterium]
MYDEDISRTNENFERYKERLTNFSNEFELGLFVFLARKSLLWVILFFMLAGAGAFAYLRYTQPIFEASTILQITSNNTAQQVLNVDNIYETDDISGDIELLRSKEFFRSTLDALGLDVGYFAEGQFLTGDNYKKSAYLVQARVIDSALYNTRIDIQFPSKETVELAYVLKGESYGGTYPVSRAISLPHADLKIKLLDYEQFIEGQGQVKSIQHYFQLNLVDHILNQYYPQLSVRLLNDAAKTVQISFRDDNAQKTSDIATALAQRFIDYDVERRSESAKQVLNFIDRQVDQVYGRLKTSETSIQEFKKENRLSESDDFTSIYLDRLNNLEGE